MTGFIGGGNMAEAIIKGLSPASRADIIVSEPREDRRRFLADTYKVRTTASNADVVQASEIVVIAVKPQVMEEVLAPLASVVSQKNIFVSIAAGIRISFIKRTLNTEKVVRVMPNTPALVGEGMSVISMCECFHCVEMGRIKDLFMSVGKVLVLPEKYMDAVTALSGSGPAFIALFMESLTEAAVEEGLSPGDAHALALQTALGTVRMLEEGTSPARLREMVTSPGGTTAAGLKAFEERGFKETVRFAVRAAAERSRQLGRD